ncbi:MAG TPA: hypothetical protein VIK04_00785, partial [Solirubrobacteraceae bacterium]
ARRRPPPGGAPPPAAACRRPAAWRQAASARRRGRRRLCWTMPLEQAAVAYEKMLSRDTRFRMVLTTGA